MTAEEFVETVSRVLIDELPEYLRLKLQRLNDGDETFEHVMGDLYNTVGQYNAQFWGLAAEVRNTDNWLANALTAYSEVYFYGAINHALDTVRLRNPRTHDFNVVFDAMEKALEDLFVETERIYRQNH